MEQKRNSNNNYENQVGLHPVHSQVRKIKQESEKNTIIVDWLPGQPEMRPALREITSRQISRSPLGLSGRPISVGDS
ncbi:hypothetical protein HS088_TW20G00663 [Tripterygium wilfordii]|uniref:Uncharacterized protein n=1 Tax=Tripterygium wilfordii TaxID=458696 RepID=A0A7J7C860_TRIWF|nr:hypothetical protein HS088_TW20G00663 [Tripterygium wilfordii]